MKQSLYIVVYDTGLVKVGACQTESPKIRITTHIATGRSFGHSTVHHDFCVVEGHVYSKEEILCRRISRHAVLANGKEWFKFPDAEAAVTYAKDRFLLDCTEPMIYPTPAPIPKPPRAPSTWSSMARAKLHILRGKSVREVCKMLHIQKRYIHQADWYIEYLAAQSQTGEK